MSKNNERSLEGFVEYCADLLGAAIEEQDQPKTLEDAADKASALYFEGAEESHSYTAEKYRVGFRDGANWQKAHLAKSAEPFDEVNAFRECDGMKPETHPDAQYPPNEQLFLMGARWQHDQLSAKLAAAKARTSELEGRQADFEMVLRDERNTIAERDAEIEDLGRKYLKTSSELAVEIMKNERLRAALERIQHLPYPAGKWAQEGLTGGDS